MLVFGWRTALLVAAEAQLVVLALALLLAARNRAANRLMAALLVVAAGMLAPYALGFAGAYDRWPGLTFAPFAAPLAVGPLLFGYARALTGSRAGGPLAPHLAPALGHGLYQSALFALPTGPKLAWYLGGHERWVEPALALAVVLSLGGYGVAGLGLLRAHRAGLPERVSDAERHAAGWLAQVLICLLALLALRAGFAAWQLAFGRLDYFDRFAFYAAFAVLALYLGVQGWRHAELRAPEPAPPGVAPETPRAKDWPGLGRRWRERIAAEAWWREPELSLADVARRLGVNTGYLSRGLNEGLGVNFATLINGLRAEEVARSLRSGRADDLLGLALEAGFSSKASFNRAFRAVYGCSPSDYRRAHGSEAEDRADGAVLRRAPGLRRTGSPLHPARSPP